MSAILTDRRTEAELTLSAYFERMKSQGARELRRAAWEEFSRLGLPTRRVEDWHYTDLRAAMRHVPPLAPDGAEPVRLAQDDRLRLAVADGAYAVDPSDLAAAPEGVTISSLRQALAEGDAQVTAALASRTDAAVALNAALAQDGVVLRIAPGTHVQQPIALTTLLFGEVSAFTRNVVIVGAGARVTIAEATQPLPSGAQENHALVLALGAGAKVELISDFCFGEPGAIRVHSLIATLAERSALNSHCLIWGGGLLRRQVFATLAGEGAEAAFNGATLLRGGDHADTTLSVEHVAPHCKSRERFRTIVDGEATGVFQGKVVVRPGAQKSDGVMQSKALLLSDGASMNNKPELEIYADDVACGHGATCGRLDKEQLFYLQARGLPRREAEALLVEGFANEAFSDLENESLRAELQKRVAAWLAMREDAA